jgi:hypothetical protein
MYRITPANDSTDFYAVGYDGNAFPTAEDAAKALAEKAFAEDAFSDGWQVVEVPYDAAALRRAGYTVEVAS